MDLSKLGNFFNFNKAFSSDDTAKIDKRMSKGKDVNVDKMTSYYRTYGEDDNQLLHNNNGGIGIESTAVKSARYNPNSERALIQFQGGDKEYSYRATPKEFNELLNAPSKGQHINRVWKKYNQDPDYAR